MKRVVQFTPHQLETWLAVLGCFDVKYVNRAVLEIGLSEDPFPDLGKLVERCRAYRADAARYTDGHGTRPSEFVAKTARALGLDV